MLIISQHGFTIYVVYKIISINHVIKPVANFGVADQRLLHWSNLVGASHSKHYSIWQYGAYSTKGVKEVCEFGYPRTLEEEMRAHVSMKSLPFKLNKTQT